MNSRIPLAENSIICSTTDSYKISRLLSAAGGSSLTYYAVRQSDHQLTVLKELYPQELARCLRRDGQRMTTTENSGRFSSRWNQYAQLFRQEGERVRQLQNAAAQAVIGDNAAALAPEYAFFSSVPFEDNNTWYIAVCTGEGKTISGDGLSFAEILQRMISVCTAIGGLHQAGFAHFDIKPDNLFVMPSGQVKLLDFGSMQEHDATDRRVHSYSEGFSAPWLLRAASVSGIHADIYSVTAVFFYLLFGCTIDEAEGFENGIPKLQMLTVRSFPEKLYGRSFSTINAVFSLLRRNLNHTSQSMTDSIDALCQEFAELAAQCRREDAGGILGSEEIVHSLCELYALTNEFPRNLHLQKMYAEQQKPWIVQSLEQNGAFKACMDAVRRLLYIKAEYEKSLFCLFFLEENTDMSRRQNSDQLNFYEFIVKCCDKLGQSRLRADYLQKAAQISPSRAEKWKHQSENVLMNSDAYEARFEFEKMLRNESEFVQEMCSSDNENAADTICAQQDVDRYLAIHAGKLVEALCLCRPEGWQNDARAILTHIAAYLSDCEDSFRDRSIDNLLHFAIEIRDAALFEQALDQLSAWHPLHRGDAASVGEWIRESAERLSGAQKELDAYALYLFLKSVNLLFFESLDEGAAQALCSMLEQREQDSLNVWHPQSLIYAHSAILACRMAAQGRMSRCSCRTFRQNLAEIINQSGAGIVRLIAEAGYLTVCRYAEDATAQKKAYLLLAEDIRQGIKANKLSDTYFADALESGICEDLLAKFRFRHS